MRGNIQPTSPAVLDFLFIFVFPFRSWKLLIKKDNDIGGTCVCKNALQKGWKRAFIGRFNPFTTKDHFCKLNTILLSKISFGGKRNTSAEFLRSVKYNLQGWSTFVHLSYYSTSSTQLEPTVSIYPLVLAQLPLTHNIPAHHWHTQITHWDNTVYTGTEQVSVVKGVNDRYTPLFPRV